MTDEPKVYRAPLSDFSQLPDNPNTGSERGEYMLGQSVDDFGAGRAMLAGSDGVFIAGNHAAEHLHEKLGDEAIVIETDGKTPVIVKRTDVKGDSERGREMAVADNRTSEVNMTWDADVMRLLDEADDINLEKWFREDELSEMGAIAEYLDVIGNVGEPAPRSQHAMHMTLRNDTQAITFSLGELHCIISSTIYKALLAHRDNYETVKDFIEDVLGQGVEAVAKTSHPGCQ
jgi:hypothetical protein